MVERRIKFRHLQCFLEVAQHQSVVKAADALALTQPAVSRTIRELEDYLDSPLFDRSKRGVRLSTAGEVFLRYASASVTAFNQGIDSIVQAQKSGQAVIRIGVLPTVAARLVPDAVKRFKARGLGTIVDLATGANTALMSSLRVGELDLVVGRLAEAEQMIGFNFEHLYSETITFVVRPGHPLLDLDPFDIKAMTTFEMVYPDQGAIIRHEVDRFMIAHSVRVLPERVETVSSAFARAYVCDTDAVWAISSGVCQQDVDAGLLVALPIDASETAGPVGLTSHADQPLSPAIELFMQATREAADALRSRAASEDSDR